MNRRRSFGIITGAAAAIALPFKGEAVAAEVVTEPMVMVPYVFDIGGTYGTYDPDGGSYPQGAGAAYGPTGLMSLSKAKKLYPHMKF